MQDLAAVEVSQPDPPQETDTPSQTTEASGTQGTSLPDPLEIVALLKSNTSVTNVLYNLDLLGIDHPDRIKEYIKQDTIKAAAALSAMVLDVEAVTDVIMRSNLDDKAVAYCCCAGQSARAGDMYDSFFWLILAANEASDVFGSHTVGRVVACVLDS